MPSLDNKKILLGVTGGIAAYKTPELVRLLKKQGAEVQVIMTPAAKQFVTGETLSVVSGKPVYSDFFDEVTGEWNNHVELGLWPDLMIFTPVTAASLAKMVQGISDNLLITTFLSARCPVVIAPAMDLDMMVHPSTTRNLEQLKSDGFYILEPGTGELASGLTGKGRMPEPNEIVNSIIDILRPQLLFSGKKVLITAGPTYENIDPVRFIGNYSTGKMGYALAEAFRNYGASVDLIAGPVHLPNPEDVTVHKVVSAIEMLEKCKDLAPVADVIIMSAAVADYRPVEAASEKIKKTQDTLQIDLIKNPDILFTLASAKKANQWICGFALETTNELENAKQKLQRKGLDMIVLNSLKDDGAGFGYDTNKATFIFANGPDIEIPLMSKSELAIQMVQHIAQYLNIAQ